MEAHRRSRAGSGDSDTAQAIGSTRQRPIEIYRLPLALSGGGNGRTQGHCLPIRPRGLVRGWHHKHQQCSRGRQPSAASARPVLSFLLKINPAMDAARQVATAAMKATAASTLACILSAPSPNQSQRRQSTAPQARRRQQSQQQAEISPPAQILVRRSGALKRLCLSEPAATHQPETSRARYRNRRRTRP